MCVYIYIYIYISPTILWPIKWKDSVLKRQSRKSVNQIIVQNLAYQNYLNLSSYFREGNGNPLQHSCLENPMDRGAWSAAVHGVAQSWTRLSDFTFTFNFHAVEKKMATHSRVLAWRIPGAGEPGGLPSLGSHRVGHDWSDLAASTAWIKLPYTHMKL